MEWVVVVVLVSAVLLGGAFVLGLQTNDRRWAAVAAILPLGLLAWTVVVAATENKSECYDACGSTWLLAFTVASVVPALVLAGAVLLGVAVNRRGPSREARRGQPASS